MTSKDYYLEHTKPLFRAENYEPGESAHVSYIYAHGAIQNS